MGFNFSWYAPPYPSITTPPASQAGILGGTASFNVVAGGQAPLGYQWQTNGGSGFANVSNGGSFSGVTSNILTLTGITTNQALAYRVIVTNSLGSVTSSVANLTVLPFVAPPVVPARERWGRRSRPMFQEVAPRRPRTWSPSQGDGRTGDGQR
jgi:hypothetical protein